MSASAVVPGIRATGIIARLTLKRLLRSRGVWLTLGLALLPIVVATLAAGRGDPHDVWKAVFGIGLLLYCIAPPIHLASTIAEEIDDKTFTYLWSRPFPRWAVITGKVFALLPALCLLFSATLGASFYLAWSSKASANTELLIAGLQAASLGMAAVAGVCIGLGSIVPRFPLVISIVYLLILDNAIGKLPVALHHASVNYNMKVVAKLVKGDPATAALWLVVIGALWLTVALWRIRSTEFQTDK